MNLCKPLLPHSGRKPRRLNKKPGRALELLGPLLEHANRAQSLSRLDFKLREFWQAQIRRILPHACNLEIVADQTHEVRVEERRFAADGRSMWEIVAPIAGSRRCLAEPDLRQGR